MRRGCYAYLGTSAGLFVAAAGFAVAALPSPSLPITILPVITSMPSAADRLGKALPSGWAAHDIGSPGTAGSTRVEGSGATPKWTIAGRGQDIWGSADQFQFASTPLPAGDGGITARLLSQRGGNSDGWAKTGLQIRESTEPGALMSSWHYTNGHNFEGAGRIQPKDTPVSSGASGVGPSLTEGPIFMRNQRKGRTYQHLLSRDGKNWFLMGQIEIPIDPSKPALAGLEATMQGGSTPVVAVFDNVSVSAEVVSSCPFVPAPARVQAFPGTGKVLLTFSAVPNAAGYNVYRRQREQPADQAVRVNPKPTENSWLIDDGQGKGLPNGAPLVYSVRAVVKSPVDSREFAEGVTSSNEVGVEPQQQ